jgi:hypothetical protein
MVSRGPGARGAEEALDVPIVIAFTVARYSSPPHSAY